MNKSTFAATNRIITDISDYIFVDDTDLSIGKADAIFLPGGSHPEQPEYAAELYKKGLAWWLIPSGGISIKRDSWPGVRSKADIYDKLYESDCEFFTDVLIKNGVPKDAYPYGRGDNHISIKAVRKTKKALKTEEIKALLDYRRTSMPPKQWRNVDLAMLSFMLNGANMLDIAQLTYKDNYDAGSKTIHFIRQKTFNETSTLTEINIPITKGINWMIKQYGNSNNPNNYIFNILRPVDNTPERIRRRVHDITRAIDKTLKRVAKKCGIREDISFQFFRHTHATFIIKNGCEIYDVMVSMGHRDIKTTQLYISSLPEDEPEFSKKKQELLQGVYE